MTMPTMYDPSLAPEGKHIMGIFLQYAPYTLKEGSWDDIRESYADHVIDGRAPRRAVRARVRELYEAFRREARARGRRRPSRSR